MRKRIFMAIFCFLVMAALPLLSAKNGIALSDNEITPTLSTESSAATKSDKSSPEKSDKTEPAGNTESSDKEETSDSDKKSEQKFKILDTSSDKIISVSDREFCYGALAYEMPPSFEEEALKAQTVALYTYFCRLRNIQKETPDDDLKGADFSANLSENQFYLSDEQLRKKWGNLYDDSIKKIHSAVDSVFGKVLTDTNGELIDACYHAISSGTTENAKDIFGKDCEYLIAVPSPTDINAPDYLTKCSFTKDEFKEKISSLSKDIKLPEKPENYIGAIKRTPSGSVTEITIGGEKFTGSDIRSAFGLRSAAFEINYADNKFSFTVKGYGHGVGLSQWGAQGMAKQGAGYEEILKHYYQKVKIKN